MTAKRNKEERETISRERVRQIQHTAMAKMRRILLARGYKFEDFFDDAKGEADGRRQARTAIKEGEYQSDEEL